MELLARIRNGVVVNVIVADEETPDWRGYVPLPDGVWIGWVYKDGQFIAPESEVPEGV